MPAPVTNVKTVFSPAGGGVGAQTCFKYCAHIMNGERICNTQGAVTNVRKYFFAGVPGDSGGRGGVVGE